MTSRPLPPPPPPLEGASGPPKTRTRHHFASFSYVPFLPLVPPHGNNQHGLGLRSLKEFKGHHKERGNSRPNFHLLCMCPRLCSVTSLFHFALLNVTALRSGPPTQSAQPHFG